MPTSLIPLFARQQPEGAENLLLECHQRIRTFLRLAEAVGARLTLSAPDVVDACERCERYFREALPLHVRDEEESVLPRLASAGLEVRDALTEMRAQHQAHAQPLADLLNALEAVRAAPGEPAPRACLLESAMRVAAQFEPHLALEERTLFPAVRCLPEETQAEIVAELRARRRS